MDYESVFADDYLYFYDLRSSDEQSDKDAALLDSIFQNIPAGRLLDVGCGEGRIIRRLRRHDRPGIGIDNSKSMIAAARMRDPEGRDCYVHGDLRTQDYNDHFAGAYSWFTSYGYESDEENRRFLSAMVRALVPEGMLAIEVINKDFILQNQRESIVVERGDDFMIDQIRYDTLTGRLHTNRTYIRDGVRRQAFFVRLFALPELCDWLSAAGLTDVETPVSVEDVPPTRLIVTGRKP